MTPGSLPPIAQVIEHNLITAPQFTAAEQAHAFARWWHKVNRWQPRVATTPFKESAYFPELPRSALLESNNLHSPRLPRLLLKGVNATKQIRALASHKIPILEDETPPPIIPLPAPAKTFYLAGHLEVTTGEIVFDQTEFRFPGPINFRWRRTFRSGSKEDFGFGPGWSHSLCERMWIRPSPDNRENLVDYLAADGRYIQFAQPSIGEACINRCEGIVLHRQGHMSYRLISADQPDRIFRADGANAYLPLVELRDAADNTLSIDYQNGLPRKIVSSWGRVLEFNCEQNRIVSIASTVANSSALARYEYTEGLLTKAIDHQARGEIYRYSNSNIAARECRNGLRHEFSWSDKHQRYNAVSAGELRHTLTWRASLRHAEMENSLGHKTWAKFDTENRLIRFCDAEGCQQSWFYDNYGNLCSHTDAMGSSRYYRWDGFCRCVRATNALEVSTHYHYDDRGNPVLIEQALNKTWQREYNDHGQLVAERDPVGHIWQYHYNEKQQLTTLIDPEGGKTRLQWNSLGELEQVTAPEGKITQCEYDAEGRLIRIKRGSQLLLGYNFNPHNRIAGVQIEDGEIWALRYDDLGRISTIEANDFAIHCEFDSQGRISAVKTRSDAWQFQYDPANLVKISSGQGTETRQYDKNGRLAAVENGDGRRHTFEYDANGRLKQYRDMAVISYIERDKLGKVTKITNNSGESRQYHYDDLGRLVLADNVYSTVRFHYDLCDKITAEHHESDGCEGHSFVYQYDKRGWRIKSTENQLFSYQHTPDGNLRGIDINGKAALRCDYDDQNREIVWVQGEVKTKFTWTSMQLCALESRKGKQQEVSFQHNFNSHPITYLQSLLGIVAAANSATRGKVDNRGNLLCEPASDGMSHYHYNGWNQLVSVEGDEFKTYYRYDPFGRRIAKQITHRKSKHARQTTFRWQNGHMWSEQHTGPKGTDVLHYLHHPHTGALVAMTREEKTYYVLNTPGQQPLLIFAANGDPVWHANYDKEGKYLGLNAKPALSSPWRGANLYYDSESQLYYDGQGYYSPKLGRNLKG